MKKITLQNSVILLFIVLFLAIDADAFPEVKRGVSSNYPFTEPRATFEKLWIDYNVTEDNVKGMRIHVKFKVYEMKDLDSYLAIYFQNENGTPLKDKNKKFHSTSGDVALYRSLKPAYDPTVYEDLPLFMPYDELDLGGGNYKLKMEVKIIYKQGGEIQRLTSHYFDFTNPKSEEGKPLVATAAYKSMSVDYDVEENGVRGMRIHVNFSASNLKNTNCYLAIYFEKKDGRKLYTNNTNYSSKDGQVAVYKLLKPSYDETDYNDLQVFMPYREFNLTPGKYDLKMKVNLIYENGNLIKHFTYYDFLYEKNK